MTTPPVTFGSSSSSSNGFPFFSSPHSFPASSLPPPSPVPQLPVEQHRHSTTVQSALKLLKELAGQACDKGGEEDEDDETEQEEGIIANLENSGWIHQTTTDGIRIFRRDAVSPPSSSSGAHIAPSTYHEHAIDDTSSFDVVPPHHAPSTRTTTLGGGRKSTGTGGGGGVMRGTGIRADEEVRFRGEGWIEGGWKLSDVAATIVNTGARAVWDPRFDLQGSQVVAHLSSTDTLWSLHIRAELGTDRHASLVSTFEEDVESKTGYVASTSVDDSLIPRTGSRTLIHLNGYCLRQRSEEPHFEPPPPADAPEEAPAPTRPGHRRTKSSMSFANPNGSGGGGLLSPGLVPPPLPPLDTLHAHQSRSPFFPPLATAPLPATQPDLQPSPPVDSTTKAGLHVSLLVHVSPGFNLSQTVVNQLSVHLPLSIAAIGRYLSTHGFAPHFVRRRREEQVEVMEETFEAQTSSYKVVYRVGEAGIGSVQKVRFHGSSFAKGRLDIEVQNAAKGWWVEYDVQPDVEPEVKRTEADEDDSDDASTDYGSPYPNRPRPAPPRKSSLSILSSPNSMSPPSSSLAAARPLPSSSLPNSSASFSDPARLPGPLGGCTLHIPSPPSSIHLPITITITKNSLAISRPLDQMSRISHALGHASRLDTIARMNDTVEELIENSMGEGRAKVSLAAAKQVLLEVRKAKEEEERRLEGENLGHARKWSTSGAAGGGGVGASLAEKGMGAMSGGGRTTLRKLSSSVGLGLTVIGEA